MKSLKYIFMGFAALALTTSCSEDQLETSPTTAVSGTTMTESNDAAMISLNGLYRSMYTSGWSTTGNTHQCFGLSAYALMADVMGDDCIMSKMGSGWFWFDATYDVKDAYTSGAWRSYDLWYAYFTYMDHGFLLEKFTEIANTPESIQMGLKDMMMQGLNEMKAMRPIDFSVNVLTIIIVAGFAVGLPIAALMQRKELKIDN